MRAESSGWFAVVLTSNQCYHAQCSSIVPQLSLNTASSTPNLTVRMEEGGKSRVGVAPINSNGFLEKKFYSECCVININTSVCDFREKTITDTLCFKNGGLGISYIKYLMN